MRKVLLVEDDDPKRDNLEKFLLSKCCFKVDVARSVRSAIQKIESQKHDILLLDMSLNTFDIGPDESGGRPQSFGGVEVMRQMKLFDINLPVIVVTQYEAFSRNGSELNHKDLCEELAEKFPQSFKGLVYYNSVYGGWKEKLSELLSDTLEGGAE